MPKSALSIYLILENIFSVNKYKFSTTLLYAGFAVLFLPPVGIAALILAFMASVSVINWNKWWWSLI